MDYRFADLWCSKGIFYAKTKNHKQFIKESENIHKNKYDYSKTDYIKNDIKVIIICKKHGEFFQSPNGHKNGQGCPNCKKSNGEKFISELLEKFNIEYENEYQFKDLIGYHGKPLRFDFKLKNNILIEYDGEQHFKSIKGMGGKIGFYRRKRNDKIKNEYCINNGLRLIRIPYNMSKNDIEIIIKSLK